METKRQYYPTKADWASAKAVELRREARLLPMVSTMDWRGIKQRQQTQRHFMREADRYEAMAERFRAAGR